MKSRKSLAIIIVAVVCAIMLSACGGKQSIVGHWEQTGGSSSRFSYFYFYSDGTYSSGGSNYKGSYSIDGNNIRLEGFLVDDVNGQIKISGDTFTLEYWGRTETYKRIQE